MYTSLSVIAAPGMRHSFVAKSESVVEIAEASVFRTFYHMAENRQFHVGKRNYIYVVMPEERTYTV